MKTNNQSNVRENTEKANKKIESKLDKLKYKIFNNESSTYIKINKYRELGKESSKIIKMEYFDNILNAERKINNLIKILNKIRLRIVHKPFIIIDMLKLAPNKNKNTIEFSKKMNNILLQKKKKVFDHLFFNLGYQQKIVEKWSFIVVLLKKKSKNLMKHKIEKRMKQVTKNNRKLQILKRSSKFFGMIMNKIIKQKKSQYFRDIILRLIILKNNKREEKLIKNTQKRKSNLNQQKIISENTPKHTIKVNQNPKKAKQLELPQKDPKNTAKKPLKSLEFAQKSPEKTNKNFKKRNDGMNILLEHGSSKITTNLTLDNGSSKNPIKRTSLDSENKNQFKFKEISFDKDQYIINVSNQNQINKNDFTSNSEIKESGQGIFSNKKDIIENFNLQSSNKKKGHLLSAKRRSSTYEEMTSDYRSPENEAEYKSNGIPVELFNLISVFNFKIKKKQRFFVNEGFCNIFNFVVEDQLLKIFKEFCHEMRKTCYYSDLKKIAFEVNRRRLNKEQCIYSMSRAFIKKKKSCFSKIKNFNSNLFEYEENIQFDQPTDNYNGI